MRQRASRSLFIGMLAACTNATNTPLNGDRDSPVSVLTDLSSNELAWLAAILPTAAKKQPLVIPTEMLPQEDTDSQNTSVLALYDTDDRPVGFARDIFTHVSCNGSCQAIRFLLIYDANRAFLDIFHPAGTAHDFMKYWQDEHVPFTDGDRLLLKNVVANPPEALLAITDTAELVANATATAPTLPAFQDVVVRGAAFTTYTTVIYRLDTDAILAALVTEGAAP